MHCFLHHSKHWLSLEGFFFIFIYFLIIYKYLAPLFFFNQHSTSLSLSLPLFFFFLCFQTEAAKMSLLKRQCNYSKLDKEDPDEVLHRKAQFLIYKVMAQADSSSSPRKRSRHSFLRIRLCRLKVKIGKRLKKLRKCMVVNISAARIAFHKQVVTQLKTWKRFFGHGESITSLPPLLNWKVSSFLGFVLFFVFVMRM